MSVYSLLRYRFNVFLPPLPKVGCPDFLEIWNPWGKVMERRGLRVENFTNKGCKIAAQFFLGGQILPFAFTEQDFFGICVSHSV